MNRARYALLFSVAVLPPSAALSATLGARAHASESFDHHTTEARSAPDSTLTVTGEGETQIRPDLATVRLAVEAQADSAEAAQQAVNDAMQKVISNVTKTGVEKKHIQTAGLHLHPVYATQTPGQESAESRITGYRASNMVRIDVHELEDTGKVIDAGLKGGANRLEDVSFGLQKEEHCRIAALDQAAKNAHAKAVALANSLGVALGSIRSVQEGSISVRPPQPMETFRTARFAAATPVQPGEVKVNASVTVSYNLNKERENVPGG